MEDFSHTVKVVILLLKFNVCILTFNVVYTTLHYFMIGELDNETIKNLSEFNASVIVIDIFVLTYMVVSYIVNQYKNTIRQMVDNGFNIGLENVKEVIGKMIIIDLTCLMVFLVTNSNLVMSVLTFLVYVEIIFSITVVSIGVGDVSVNYLVKMLL